jgi:hypothetical protein
MYDYLKACEIVHNLSDAAIMIVRRTIYSNPNRPDSVHGVPWGEWVMMVECEANNRNLLVDRSWVDELIDLVEYDRNSSITIDVLDKDIQLNPSDEDMTIFFLDGADDYLAEFRQVYGLAA